MNDFQSKISNLLDSKGALTPCNRCGNDEFSIIDDEWPVTYSKGGWVGSSIPCAILICTKCGNMIFHSIKQLERSQQDNEKG